MKTEWDADIVTIDGIKYSGYQNINQIVLKNFTIYFSSNGDYDIYYTNEGFILNWSCTELFWSEWTQSLYRPCSEERKLTNNQTNDLIFGSEIGLVIGPRSQYRNRNGSCGKLSF